MSETEKSYKYEQIAAELLHLIQSGTFSPGDRVPSVRQLSRQKKASISTIMEAYYLLEAQGWIEAWPRSGFYVRQTLPSALPEPGISSPVTDPTQVSMREIVTRVVLTDARNPNLIQLGAAHPNPKLVATKTLNRIMTSVARRMGDESGAYDYVPGCKPLRVQIARRSLSVGCRLTPDDILVTSGCSEAINLCLRAVCQPGDTVAIESPTAFDTLLCLEVLGLRALEIPTHPHDGMSLEALRFALEYNPVNACLITNFNNPLGSCMDDESRRALVELLTEQQIPLIENDIFGEIYFDEQRPAVAKAYDKEGLVMLCSSFSKSVCPGYRVGWVVPGRYKQTVEWLKYTTSLATATLPAYAIAEFMAGGSYDPYLRRIRREYSRRLAAMSQAVQRYFPEECKLTRPAGGFVLWVQLPEKVDSLALYKRALEAGIAITPGHLFSAAEQYHNFIRLNAANWSEEAEGAVERLGGFIGKMG
ncbi:MAG: PLP-dependent aminotransferase family protein [Anaerolineales bacterium]